MMNYTLINVMVDYIGNVTIPLVIHYMKGMFVIPLVTEYTRCVVINCSDDVYQRFIFVITLVMYITLTELYDTF